MNSLSPITILRCLAFCLAIASQPLALSAQNKPENLVQNPSFEGIEPGKSLTTDSPIEVAAGWSSPNAGESLLFTTRGEFIYDSHGALWPFKARTGKNVAGMNVYGGIYNTHDREYIQGTLKQPLTVGKVYRFAFWVHYHCEGANNIGIVFLPDKIKDTASGLLNFRPVSYQKEVTLYNHDKRTWTLVHDTFVAARPYRNFIIGNFFPDSLTKIEDNGFSHHFAYVDDILVVEMPNQPTAKTLITKEEEEKWKENTATGERLKTSVTTTSPSNRIVYFKFDSAKITPEAAAILDDLAAQLLQNPGAKIELKGHASSEGGDGYNLRLSERRNQSVRKYLLGKGVAASAISFQSLGEAEPAVSNDSEQNRGRNRRVEIGWEGK